MSFDQVNLDPMKKIIKEFNKILFLLLLFSAISSFSASFAQDLEEGIEPTIQNALEEEIKKSISGDNEKSKGFPKLDKKTEAKPNDGKKAPPLEELITFSARNISVKDAFATLARISGKSISVGSDIRDDEKIAVIEIKEQPFEEAFYSLIDASMVNFSQIGESYTVIKGQSVAQVMIFGLGASSVDKDLPTLERTADLSYDNQDLATLLKDIANKYGIDIVLTATPTERVSARVRNVNVEKALDLVLSGTSFDYTKPEEEDGSEEDTYIIYNKLNKNFTLGQKSKLFTLMNIEAMEVQALLPVQMRTNVRVSNDQNAIIADGSPNELKQLNDFLVEIDKPLPQVELEVRLVEVQKRQDVDLMFLQSSFSLGNFTIEGPDSTGDNMTFVNGGIKSFKFNKEDIKIFDNQVTYLESHMLAKVRAYPKLVSLSGRTAMINIDVDTNLVLGAATGQGQQIGVVATQQLQRITAGTALSITPIVGSGGLISTKVQIEVSDNSGTVDQNGVKIPATTTRRRISNEIQLRDGETVGIGGLIIDNESIDRQGFPFLTRIPVVGDIFNNRTRGATKSELLVLITPTIRNIPQEEDITADKKIEEIKESAPTG